MSELNHRPRPDVLAEATAALRDAPIPAGPSTDLTAATLAAIDSRLAGPVPARSPERRKRIMRYLSFGSLATAAAVAAVVLLLPGRSPADDVKKAVRKAEAAKTVRMTIALDAGADGKITARNYLDNEGGKFRSEVDPAGLVVVINGKGENKGIMYLTSTKMYRLLDPDKDELVKQVTGSVKKAFDQFKLPTDDQVKGLADEFLDGRKTKVYEITGMDIPDVKGNADLKIWIDPKTDLPVQSRVVSRIDGKTVTATAAYLGFDEDLDPKLFDTKVPDGYKPLPAGAKLEQPKKDK
jgi:outer membrane lipoprotein-sorting protein